MSPIDFIRTLYLGDRGCKNILIDGWTKRVVVQVTQISRVRSPSGNWEFYSDEDITDGLIVFSGVRSVRLDPPGLVPNDFIINLEAEAIVHGKIDNTEQKEYLFTLRVSAADEKGLSTEVAIEVVGKGLHLEDPAQPGRVITN